MDNSTDSDSSGGSSRSRDGGSAAVRAFGDSRLERFTYSDGSHFCMARTLAALIRSKEHGAAQARSMQTQLLNKVRSLRVLPSLSAE